MPQRPVILLPGLGATEAVFAPQARRFPNIQVPPWPTPQLGEPLAEYARRLADEINPGGPCVVGGISFGGILATELCRHVQAERCILISSVRSPKHLPVRVRVLLPIGRRIAPGLVAMGQSLLRAARPLAHALTTRRAFALYNQGCKARPEIVSWSMRALAEWQPSPGPLPCPIDQIHGSWDHVFPLASAPDAHVIPRGRHVLTLTQPREVNEFLAPLID